MVKREEAEQGYNEESSDEENLNQELKEELEDRWNQPLEIDLNVIRKKAAELMGIPMSELPEAKAASKAAFITAQNPPPVHYDANGEEIK